MKTYNKFLNENVNNFIIGDRLKSILQILNHPISTSLLQLKNSPIPYISFIDVSDKDDSFSFGKTSESTQHIIIGRLINRLFPDKFLPRSYQVGDIESFVDKYKVLFPRKSVKVDKLLDDDVIKKLLETSSKKYITKLDKTMYQNIRNKYCTTYDKNKVLFYRGDKSLNGDYYLINGKETKTKLQFPFNYITTEFVSSDLWKNKNYPLKKHSVNMTSDYNLTRNFAQTYYAVIPFDGAKFICMHRLFGNYVTDLFVEELGTKFNDPSDLARILEELIEKDITLNNVNTIIKELENIFDDPVNRRNNKRYGDKATLILNNMEKHNMKFRKYMEFIFAPENYDILDYSDMNQFTLLKYIAEYTDSYVLLAKMERLDENITSTGRWGNVGAGILPYCSKTKRFLLSYRSKFVLEPHTWGIWGGKVDEEDLDDIEKTAIRELREETEYKGDIKIIPSYVYNEDGFTYYNFIGLVESEFIPDIEFRNELNFTETEDYKWVTLDELLDIRPKHFGLIELIDNNIKQLKNI